MINPDTDPTLISDDIVNTVGDCLAQLLVLEVMASHFFRLPLWVPFLPSVLEVPDQLLLLGID